MNHILRAKQQKQNLDKLDKILASLPEAQYDHSEEEAPAKKSKNKKSAETLKKQSAKKKSSAKKEAPKKETSPKKEALKKEGTITEDDVANAEKKIQNYTDKFCKEIDDLTAAKEKEIMEF